MKRELLERFIRWPRLLRERVRWALRPRFHLAGIVERGQVRIWRFERGPAAWSSRKQWEGTFADLPGWVLRHGGDGVRLVLPEPVMMVPDEHGALSDGSGIDALFWGGDWDAEGVIRSEHRPSGLPVGVSVLPMGFAPLGWMDPRSLAGRIELVWRTQEQVGLWLLEDGRLVDHAWIDGPERTSDDFEGRVLTWRRRHGEGWEHVERIVWDEVPSLDGARPGLERIDGQARTAAACLAATEAALLGDDSWAIRERRHALAADWLLGMAAVLFLACLVGGAVLFRGASHAIQAKRIETAFFNDPARIAALDSLEDALRKNAPLIRMIRPQGAWSTEIVSAVAGAMPEGVWVSRWERTGTEHRMWGFGKSDRDIAVFLTALQRDSLWKKVELRSSELLTQAGAMERAGIKAAGMVAFQLDLEVRP